MELTETQFINSEIAVWGESYIFDLIDRGYEPIALTDENTGKQVWRWVTPSCARVEFVLQ
jgi:hypothetical protein